MEHSINARLLPTKCKYCKSIDTNSFERLSSKFLSTIEIGHLPNPSGTLLLSNIYSHFTISHEDKALRYDLAGLSVYMANHFYSLTKHNSSFYKFDDMREPSIELYPKYIVHQKTNTVFYTLHSTE